VRERVRRAGREERWHGLGVSEGIVVGRVLRIHNGARHIYRATLEEADVEREVRRWHAAVRLARRQLLKIKSRAEHELGAEHAYIFDAHLFLLEDQKLLNDVESYIRNERANAEWAVKVVGDRILAVYAEIKDDYLRERGSDIEDVMQRILVALSGEGPRYRTLTEDSVVVSEDLLPSAMAELDFKYARAIATDAGGWTSHTAIIARGLGVPAVVGLREFYWRARTGDPVIVDAVSGEVILHPTKETVEHYKSLSADSAKAGLAPTESAQGPLRTEDGLEIILRANLELPAEFEGVQRFGARGVGLYRSEFLMTPRGRMPSEEEQCEAYREIVSLAGEDGATIRLFDLGGDKATGSLSDGERNPALGLRAIRFGLRHEDELRTQVRAILRAAAYGRLGIVVPMISDITDVRRVRHIIEEERDVLLSRGVTIGEPSIGAMIEVPAAVLLAEKIAREVDFFSLGTNDLVQYLLAVDRGNDEVADWFRSLHPSVLVSIKRTVEAARAASIPAVVCGEMASTPAYAAILIGLGATELSMTISAIPRVRRMVAGINAGEAKELAEECLGCETADDVEELVRVRLGSRWPNLFPPKSLPAPKSRE
jgi:phosphotransferase system enzyme I (PtsI)